MRGGRGDAMADEGCCVGWGDWYGHIGRGEREGELERRSDMVKVRKVRGVRKG